MRTYPIHHRQVGEVLEVLRQLLEAGAIERPESAAATTQPSAEAQGATAPISKPTRPVGIEGDSGKEAVVLTADPPTNRIIAVGEAALLDQLGPLIETIDVRHAQVLVEALVVSVSESLARNLGVLQLGVSDPPAVRPSGSTSRPG